MLWDFGLNPLHMDNPAAVEGKIREIEDTFHLGKHFLHFFIFNNFFYHEVDEKCFLFVSADNATSF
jgi:hypothetical protein